MHKDIEKILISKKALQKSLKKAGKRISRDYKGKNLLVVCILKGSILTTAELIKNISIPCEIDFMQASSYGSDVKTSGEVIIKKDIAQDLTGYDVLICEDIIDSGVTLSKLCAMLKERNAESVKVFTLLDKPEGRQVDFEANYFCHRVPNAFLVGFGLDYAEKYRNLPYIGILKKSVYSD